MNKEEILDGILGLSLMDAAWIVKELEDKLGVSADDAHGGHGRGGCPRC